MKTPKITLNRFKETLDSICDRCSNNAQCNWYEIIPVAKLYMIENCDTFKENEK